MRGLKERDLCRLSFGRYLTPEVSQKILKGEISLAGDLKDVTILFCDLRGYTSFVEGRDPKEVVGFLKQYFTQMEQAIKAQQVPPGQPGQDLPQGKERRDRGLHGSGRRTWIKADCVVQAPPFASLSSRYLFALLRHISQIMH